MPTEASGLRDAALPLGAEKRDYVREMFDTIAPRYDLLNTLMTFGLDRRWRRRAVAALRLAAGSVVLDLAAGTGALGGVLAAAGLRGVGCDLSLEMLRHPMPGAAPALQGDAATLPFAAGSLDGVVSGFALRNFADLKATFAEIARVLRPAGRLALLEVAEPTAPLLAYGHRIWFRKVVPRLGAALSDAGAYAYLPRSLAYLPPPAELTRALEDAGFRDVRRQPLSGGLTQVISATRRGSFGIVRDEPESAAAPRGRGVSR